MKIAVSLRNQQTHQPLLLGKLGVGQDWQAKWAPSSLWERLDIVILLKHNGNAGS